MKKFVHIIALFLIVAFLAGCETVVAPPETPNSPPSTDGKLLMKLSADGGQTNLLSSGQQVDIAYHTTLLIEGLTADTSLHIKTWQWQFPDGTASGKYAVYTPSVGAGSSIQIKLIGIDYNNVSHEVIITVNVIWNITGTGLVFLASVTPQNDGTGTLIFYFCKERIMKFLTLPGYFIKGTVNNWVRTYIPNTDTSYSLINGIFTPDAKGFYVKATLNHAPGNHKLGLGKMKNSTDELWENFQGSPYADSTDWTIVKYNLSTTWAVTPGGSGTVNPPTMPGIIGDQGTPWIIGLTPSNPKIDLFINNLVSVSSIHPFVAFRGDDARYMNNVAQVSVSGFPTAGMVQVNYATLPSNRLVAFKIGSDLVNFPSTYNDTLMRKSKFYNEEYGDIRFVICPPTLAKSNGNNPNGWTVRSAVKGVDFP